MINEPKTQKQDFNTKKLMLILPFFSFLGPVSNMAYLPALNQLTEFYNTSLEIVTLSVSIATLVGALSPLIWAPSSDFFGRKKILITEFTIFILMTIGCIFAPNIQTFIFFRVLEAASLIGSIGVCFAIVMDVVPVYSRGKALASVIFAITVGTIVGPVIGGVLTEKWGWKSIFIFLLIIATIILMIVIFFLQETNMDRKPLSAKKLILSWLRPILFFRKKIVLTVVLVNSFVFSSMYFIIVLIPTVTQRYYNWSKMNSGFSLLPYGFGGLFGTICAGPLIDYSRKRFKTLGSRLLPGVFAAFIISFTIASIGAVILRSVVFLLALSSLFSWLYVFLSSGSQAFLFEEVPGETASISSIMTLVQFGFSSISVQLTATAVGKSLDTWFYIYGACIFLFSFVLIYVIRSRWEHIKEEIKKAIGGDIEMNQKFDTPDSSSSDNTTTSKMQQINSDVSKEDRRKSSTTELSS
eukprot:Anaeramoba_flamelloidesa2984_201.p1 GENE.a2984_201~~a2984_201.p1  ORF type:complete len:477 (-),score=56.45 a2984_201:55-1458(-)